MLQNTENIRYISYWVIMCVSLCNVWDVTARCLSKIRLANWDDPLFPLTRTCNKRPTIIQLRSKLDSTNVKVALYVPVFLYWSQYIMCGKEVF